MKSLWAKARARRCARGVAAVELALALPLLILLALPVVDFARAIQAELILMTVSREGASLASRGPYSLKEESQELIGALVSTSPPLDMNGRGMIYITRVMGKKSGSVINNVVVEQYRWLGSSYAPTSAVATCRAWAQDGSCSSLPTAPVSLMAGALADGEVVNVVESFYQFNYLFSYLIPGPGRSSDLSASSGLHAMTIF